jgi:hypothetical protein
MKSGKREGRKKIMTREGKQMRKEKGGEGSDPMDAAER